MKNILIIAIVFLLGVISAAVVINKFYPRQITGSVGFTASKDSNKDTVNFGPVSSVTKVPPREFDWLPLQKEVLPEGGFTLPIDFGDLGPKLIKVGAIDLKKFEDNFSTSGGLTKDQKSIMSGIGKVPISVDSKNATFMVNFFWALGLANKNRILSDGPMATDPKQLGNFASTGGWTLGNKSAIELFSKYEIIKLTEAQQKIVEEVSAGVYRPCCDNQTNFPDCNHGMAALGLAEYLASKSFSSEEIYKAILYFNSFWFPQNYLDIAAYFKLNGTEWSQVNAATVLSRTYSSSQGYARIKQDLNIKLGNQPSNAGSGRGCGV